MASVQSKNYFTQFKKLSDEEIGQLRAKTESMHTNLTAVPVPPAPLVCCPSVAVQCLETAFEVSTDDQSLAVPMTLPEIFDSATAKVDP